MINFHRKFLFIKFPLFAFLLSYGVWVKSGLNIWLFPLLVWLIVLILDVREYIKNK